MTAVQVFENFTYDASNIISALKIILHEMAVE